VFQTPEFGDSQIWIEDQRSLLNLSLCEPNHTEVSELSRNVNLVLFGSATCSVILKCGRSATLTSKLTSPFRRRNVVSLQIVLETEKSLTRAHDAMLPSLLAYTYKMIMVRHGQSALA